MAEKKAVKKKTGKPAKTRERTSDDAAAGRLTLYRDEYDEQVYKLCLLSATDAQIGDFFGVTETTVNNWKIAHPSFFESIKKGKIQADANIAESLYNRALGYEHDEDRIFCNANGEVTTVKTKKHYPPDTAAAFIWLKNRAGWKDKQEVDHSGRLQIVSLTKDEEDL